MLITDIFPLHQVFPSYIQHFPASRYIHSISVIMYICRPLHCTYSGSLSLSLRHPTASFLVELEWPGASAARACQKYMREVQYNSGLVVILWLKRTQILYDPTGLMIQRKVRQYLLLPIGHCSSCRCSKVVMSGMQKLSSSCCTATTQYRGYLK